MDIIFSHAHCPDGFTAAFIAKKKYPEAEVIFLDHGKDEKFIDGLIEQARGKDVLMTDFSFRTREQNDRMAASAKSFLILDHHKTAREVLETASYAIFDMKRSGAGLTWDRLFGVDTLGPYGEHYEERPWYVNYVEDRDLWTWKLPNAKEICAYLNTLPYEFGSWELLGHVPLNEAARLGGVVLRYIEHYVQDATTQKKLGVLEGYTVNVTNVPYMNCSEIGNAQSDEHTISLTWFERADDYIQFSLRSQGDNDVSVIAKKFNGGGHKNAAGFQLPLFEGRKLIDQILGRPNPIAEMLIDAAKVD